MKTINLDEVERRLIVRKRELGIVGVDFLPLNDGTRRTASKRRLLRAIAENAAAHGRSQRFATKRDRTAGGDAHHDGSVSLIVLLETEWVKHSRKGVDRY